MINFFFPAKHCLNHNFIVFVYIWTEFIYTPSNTYVCLFIYAEELTHVGKQIIQKIIQIATYSAHWNTN